MGGNRLPRSRAFLIPGRQTAEAFAARVDGVDACDMAPACVVVSSVCPTVAARADCIPSANPRDDRDGDEATVAVPALSPGDTPQVEAGKVASGAFIDMTRRECADAMPIVARRG